MKIAFVTIGDTRDIKRGSGTPYHLWQELLRQGHTVHLVGPLDIDIPFPTRFFKFLSKKLGKKYISYRDPFMGKVIGKMVTQALSGYNYDIVLTNDYSIAGYAKITKPVVLYTDAFFPYDYSQNVHPWLTNLSGFGVHFCRTTTIQGLKHADKCIFASQYVAEESKKYGLPGTQKMMVIPYGANIETPKDVVFKTIGAIHKKRLDILFVGKHWKLKGGDSALKIVQMLNEKGIAAHLHVVGVDLSASISHEFVSFYGLLNKDIEMDKKKLNELFISCDILLVPSKGEGYGLVFVEAAAYAMPSMAYKSTGVMTAVRNNISGVLFDPADDETVFVRQIERWISQVGTFESISKGARQHFETTVNWTTSVSRLVDEMKLVLAEIR